MNQITEKQNQEKYLRYLAAQRQLYDEAKKWYFAFLVAGIIIAIFGNGAFFIGKWSFISPLITLLIWVYAIGEPFVLPKFASRKRKSAAKIQELFDCEVLEMPWNEAIGHKPEPEIIARSFEDFKNSRSSDAWEKLKNWYTYPDLDRLSLAQGRVACQRQNIWWDSELRRKYAFRVIVITIILFILLLAWGIVADWSLRELLTGPMAFSLSVLFIGLKHGYSHIKAANRLDNLRGVADSLWEKAKTSKTDAEDNELSQQSRNLQTEIFHHRSETIPVFSWYYNKLRDKFERIASSSREES